MKLKGIVVFDFDGTVIDTMGIYAEWVAKALTESLGLDAEIARRKYLESAGRPFIEQLQMMGVDEKIAEEISRRFTIFKKGLLRELKLNECVEWFLDELRKRNIITVLSTNNECESISSSPAIMGFHLVLCFDGEKHRKGKEHMSTLKTIFGEETTILFIGDTDYDVEVYRGLGIYSIKTTGLFKCEEARRVLSIIDSFFQRAFSS